METRFISSPGTIAAWTTLVALLALASTTRGAIRGPDEARTLSPYFRVIGGAGAERLGLKATTAEVAIAGTIARVKVAQEYANEGSCPIEAVYVFHGSTRAAVHAMRMTIGGRVRVAKVMERSAATATYRKAKSEGKGAALLEQQRPNVFEMRVANI
ncbi:MAG: trypsin, partial [Candidatus Riflebacteria bacterium]|nr:trypsin [Candidatus Riflebacteria bacterium]